MDLDIYALFGTWNLLRKKKGEGKRRGKYFPKFPYHLFWNFYFLLLIGEDSKSLKVASNLTHAFLKKIFPHFLLHCKQEKLKFHGIFFFFLGGLKSEFQIESYRPEKTPK